jgi:sugar-specific transcriptional regulator TrmB
MNDAVNGLMRLGFTEYEARAYSAIVSIGEGGIGDISLESGVPRARVYDVMERLAAKGFVEVGVSKPLRYRANDPERVIEGIMEELKKSTNEVLKRLQEIKRKADRGSFPVWLVTEEKGIDTRIRELFDASNKYVTMITSSRSLLLKYAELISEVSKRIEVTAVIENEAESFRGLLGRAKILKPTRPILSSKNRPRILSFLSRDGEKEVTVELIMISDCSSLVIYKEEEKRLAMSIEGSIIDSFLRSSLKGDLQSTRAI